MDQQSSSLNLNEVQDYVNGYASSKRARDLKFSQPPSAAIKNELMKDDIVDPWEIGGTEESKPLIGIMPIPLRAGKENESKTESYLLEANNRYITWGGSRTVAIPFNIDADDLDILLPQMNGFWFTGGALDVINWQTALTDHPYFKSMKKILNYSRYMKDVKKQDWPILGTCQGFELLAIALVDDLSYNLDTMPDYIHRKNINFAVQDPQRRSVIFADFPQYLLDWMHDETEMLHYHHQGLTIDSFKQYPQLRDFMNIISIRKPTCPQCDQIFIDTMEAKNYPIFGLTYHPEYALHSSTSPAIRDTTDEIAFYFSLMLNRQARKNQNKIDPRYHDLITKQMAVDRDESSIHNVPRPFGVMTSYYFKHTGGSLTSHLQTYSQQLFTSLKESLLIFNDYSSLLM